MAIKIETEIAKPKWILNSIMYNLIYECCYGLAEVTVYLLGFACFVGGDAMLAVPYPYPYIRFKNQLTHHKKSTKDKTN